MSTFNEIFSYRLKRAIIMRNLSMDALCEKIGNAVSKQAISKYEKGESIFNEHYEPPMAKVFALEIEGIICGSVSNGGIEDGIPDEI